MTTRILPPAEWHRLEGCGLQLAPLVRPEDAEVVVVEDEDGRIMACGSVVRVAYLESYWIEPARRANPGVVRALCRHTLGLAAKWGRWALGGAAHNDSAMAGYLERLGAQPLPVQFYAVPLKGGH